MPEKKETEIPELEEPKKEQKKTEETERKIIVVKELPMQPTNIGTITATGEEVELKSIDEALTEIYNDIKEIKKAVA